MYYGLKKTTRLRKEREASLVFSVENLTSMHFMHPTYGMLLALCDGSRRHEDLCEVLTSSGLADDAEAASAMVADLLDRFGEFLQASPRPQAPSRVYDPRDFVFEPRGDVEALRIGVPLEVAWLVTARCPHDCIYCCIDTLPAHRHPPGELTEEEALAFLEDCVASGVEVMILHGGEPFLRRDLPDLIAYLLGHDVHVRVSTKMRLPEATVEQLASAGLEELQVSIDSPDPAVADTLVGRPHYLDRAFHNIEILGRYGIRAKCNTVVTALNVRQIPELVHVLVGKGVRKISLSRYLRGFRKHRDSLLPNREDLVAMADAVRRIEAETEGLELNVCALESSRDLSLRQPGYAPCSGGKTGVIVGPEGEVTFCDRLLAFPGAIVGNVRDSTLMEIWQGGALRRFLQPEPDAFAGTECHECGLRQVCDQRMRCAYRSMMVDRRLLGPDYLCPVMPAPPVRFF